MKRHWEAAQDHNYPSAAPQADGVREQPEDKSQNAGGHRGHLSQTLALSSLRF